MSDPTDEVRQEPEAPLSAQRPDAEDARDLDRGDMDDDRPRGPEPGPRQRRIYPL